MSDGLSRLAAALADRYRIERELGQGGMATVYLAEDLKHKRKVALKVLKPELAAVLGAERFVQEITTTASLQHPHILPLFDSGTADGFLFYVMPFIEGETLRDRLERERQLPVEDALRIVREVADALSTAHGLGIIHRDIKPENILLQGGHALVADFGIALAVQSAGGSRMTQTGLSLGTPQYMSPEQAMGERVIDARSDIYALGAVTYEMLVGEAPFTGPSVQAIVARVLTEEPRSITGQRKAVPESVDAAVLRALEKLPADRFSTAAEFVTALGGGGTTPRRAKAATRASAVRARGLLIGGIALVAVALGAGWMLGHRMGGASRVEAWSTSVVLPDSLALEPLLINSEGTSTIALSPDGSQLAFVARRGKDPQIFIRRMSDFSVRALDGTERAMAPFFSPTGDAIGFFADGGLKRLSLADGRVTVVAPSVLEAWGGAWAPDGRAIVSRWRASQLVVFAPSGDSLRTIGCSDGCSFPELLPDGRRVIVTGEAGLRVIDIESAADTPLLRWQAKGAQELLLGMNARYDGDGHLVFVGHGGQVFVAPFDPGRAVLKGAPVTVVEGVRVETGRGAAQFALSRSGVLAYAPGSVMSVGILVRADRSGRLDTIPAPPAIYNALDLSRDGRRLLVRVRTVTGDAALQVVDVISGKVTPILSGPSFGRPQWAADGRRVVFNRDNAVYIVDPDVSAPPTRLPLPVEVVDVSPLADSGAFRGRIGDTVVIVHTDGRAPIRIGRGLGGAVAAFPDGRWMVSEEAPSTESSIVARALDGSGRRLVITGGGRYAMAGWAAGAREFIITDAQRLRGKEVEGQIGQGFWAVPYDSARPDQPFGEPRLLFAAMVADFPGRNYTVGMEGDRFVFKQHLVTALPREVRVLSDWRKHVQRSAGR